MSVSAFEFSNLSGKASFGHMAWYAVSSETLSSTQEYGYPFEEVLLPGKRRGFRGRRYNQPRMPAPNESVRTVMLNLSGLSAFRYDIKEIMRRYEVEETAASSVMASVIAKGSRISVDSAVEFVRDQEKAGIYPREASNEICALLDRFSRFR